MTTSARGRSWYDPNAFFNRGQEESRTASAASSSSISNVYDAYRCILRRRMRLSWERQTLLAVTKRKAVQTWTILSLLLLTSSIVTGVTCRDDGIICGIGVFSFIVTGSSGLAFAFFFRIISEQEGRIADETPLIEVRPPQHPAKDPHYRALTMDEWMLDTWSASVNFSADKGPPKQCHICFEDLITNEWVRILPCTHHYHHRCITEWSVTNQFRMNPVCPHCKYNIRDTPLDDEPAKKVMEFLTRKEKKQEEEQELVDYHNNHDNNDNNEYNDNYDECEEFRADEDNMINNDNNENNN